MKIIEKYSPYVDYSLLIKGEDKGITYKVCFASLASHCCKDRLLRDFELIFRLKVHQSCIKYREQWISLLNSFGEFEGIEYSYDYKKNIFTIKGGVIHVKFLLWFLTFVRYLQEFPEIVVDFCNKKLEIKDDETLTEFFKSHKAELSFYSNLFGHGLTSGIKKRTIVNFNTYKDILQKSHLEKTFDGVQDVYDYSLEKLKT